MVCRRGDGAPTTMWPRRGGPTRATSNRERARRSRTATRCSTSTRSAADDSVASLARATAQIRRCQARHVYIMRWSNLVGAPHTCTRSASRLLVARELAAARAQQPSTAFQVLTRGAGLRDDPRNGDRHTCISTATRMSASVIEPHLAGESGVRAAPLRWGTHLTRRQYLRHANAL